MTQDDELAAFIRSHLRCVWALEVLLLLRRDRARGWACAEVVNELRATSGLVLPILDGLVSAGLATTDAEIRYRYSPVSLTLEGLCDAVDKAYRERPVATINLIPAPQDRLQELADAFRIKGRRP